MTTQPESWRTPPARLLLGKDEAHVWRVVLDQTTPVTQAFLRILSPDELERAARYHFQKDRDHFVVARGGLRTILSRYLNVEPARLLFCYDAYGKPSLSEPSGRPPLRFNVSHAHGLALYGFTLDRRIGIDIEHIREDFASEQIAERFFSQREVAMLRALPVEMKTEGFFNCWTRKEAYIKAIGHGLSMPLDRFVVSLAPGEPAALLSVADNPQEAFRWSIKELTPDPGFVAAVVVEGHDWRLSCWRWDAGQARNHL